MVACEDSSIIRKEGCVRCDWYDDVKEYHEHIVRASQKVALSTSRYIYDTLADTAPSVPVGVLRVRHLIVIHRDTDTIPRYNYLSV